MTKGPLFTEEYKPLFSGHETFPLRYGWLKKAYDSVREAGELDQNKSVFLADDAIARFGVGKNMVASIRHWATCCSIIEESQSKISTTNIGDFLFSTNSTLGVDPYLEHPTSLWLVHWLLCSNPQKTTWFWTFSHYNNTYFKREDLVDGLLSFSDSRGWKKSSRTTIQRDVECFVRMYVSGAMQDFAHAEESLESPMSELALLRGSRGDYYFSKGKKPSLSNSMFVYALSKFWSSPHRSNTLSFEAITYDPGSPGRVFQLEENDVSDRLAEVESLTQGKYRWSETAGLKQMLRSDKLTAHEEMSLLKLDYIKSKRKVAA